MFQTKNFINNESISCAERSLTIKCNRINSIFSLKHLYITVILEILDTATQNFDNTFKPNLKNSILVMVFISLSRFSLMEFLLPFHQLSTKFNERHIIDPSLAMIVLTALVLGDLVEKPLISLNSCLPISALIDDIWGNVPCLNYRS